MRVPSWVFEALSGQDNCVDFWWFRRGQLGSHETRLDLFLRRRSARKRATSVDSIVSCVQSAQPTSRDRAFARRKLSPSVAESLQFADSSQSRLFVSRKSSSLSVKSRIRRRRNRVEEEEALRTCEELLAVKMNPLAHSASTFQYQDPTYKLSVIYPSRSSSYLLNTSVILFRLMQACTKRSKLSPFSLGP
jgi:hypothetical protein